MSLKNLITSAVLATALTGCFGPSEDTIIHIKEDVNAYSTNVQYQNEGMPFFDYIRLNYTESNGNTYSITGSVFEPQCRDWPNDCSLFYSTKKFEDISIEYHYAETDLYVLMAYCDDYERDDKRKIKVNKDGNVIYKENDHSCPAAQQYYSKGASSSVHTLSGNKLLLATSLLEQKLAQVKTHDDYLARVRLQNQPMGGIRLNF